MYYLLDVDAIRFMCTLLSLSSLCCDNFTTPFILFALCFGYIQYHSVFVLSSYVLLIRFESTWALQGGVSGKDDLEICTLAAERLMGSAT
jgi:hypothetical protein